MVSASLDQTVRVWDTTGLRKKTVRGAPSAMVSYSSRVDSQHPCRSIIELLYVARSMYSTVEVSLCLRAYEKPRPRLSAFGLLAVCLFPSLGLGGG